MTTDCAKCANSHDHINREARTRVSMCRVYNVPATPETAQGCTEFVPREPVAADGCKRDESDHAESRNGRDWYCEGMGGER